MSPRIDIAEIQRAALRSIPLTFRLTSLPHDSNALLDRILEVYLAELGQEVLQGKPALEQPGPCRAHRRQRAHLGVWRDLHAADLHGSRASGAV